SSCQRMGLAAPPNATRSFRGSIPGWRLLTVCLLPAVIMLCMIAFLLIRQQKIMRDLEATRNELRTTLNQTRDGLQLHRQKLDWVPPQHSPVLQVEHTPPALARQRPAATLQATGRKPSAEGKWRRQATQQVQPKQVGAKREPV